MGIDAIARDLTQKRAMRGLSRSPFPVYLIYFRLI